MALRPDHLEALGPKSPLPADVLKLQMETDLGLVDKLGFSTKRFPLSWVKTYRTLCDRADIFPDRKIADHLEATAARFTDGPFDAFPGAISILHGLSCAGHGLHLVTAGDELLQRKKIARAKLEPHFDSIHVTPMKKRARLAAIVKDRPEDGVMVGDSKKSDIAPALELGMHAVWVPSQTWSFAHAEIDPAAYIEIAGLHELPAVIARIAAS